MGTKTCTSCGGMGNQITYETVPDYSPGSGPLYKTVEKRVMCSSCFGRGVITTYSPPSFNPQKFKRKKTDNFKSHDTFNPKKGISNPEELGTINKKELEEKPNSKPDELDRWFEKVLPKKNRVWLSFLFSGIGALIGYSVTPQESVTTYTIVGATLGFFLIDIIYLVINLLFFSLMVLIMCGILYTVWKIFEYLVT